MATVSIIIPAYNYGHYLAEAIDSALSQTYPDVEVIVVDDGSTDDTAAVCNGYGDRIRYQYKENAGLSAARNTGVTLSKGTHFVFLDADDVLMPGMVETCMGTFERQRDEALAVVAGRRALMNAQGSDVPRRNARPPQAGNVTTTDLLRSNRFAVDAALVKREAIEACGGFDEELTSSEDRDMWIRIAAEHTIQLVDSVVVKVRVHPDSMSHDADRMYRNMTRVLNKARASAAGSSLGALFWGSVYAYRDFQVAWIHYAGGRWAKALGAGVRACLRYPLPLPNSELGQPPFFRLRALRTFILGMLRRKRA